MVTARTIFAITMLAAATTRCAGTVTQSDATRHDDAVDDLTLGSDVASDMTGAGRPPACAAAHFYIDLELEDGSRIEECLSLQDLVWRTQFCQGRGFSAYGRAVTNSLSVEAYWSEVSPPEPFPFSTTREYAFGGTISLANARCRVPDGRCARINPLNQCCLYNTRGVPQCRWALRRAGRLGEEIEAELVAPCTYVFNGTPADDTRRVTLRRARFRGMVRHNDLGVSLGHDVYEVFDCGY